MRQYPISDQVNRQLMFDIQFSGSIGGCGGCHSWGHNPSIAEIGKGKFICSCCERTPEEIMNSHGFVFLYCPTMYSET